MGKIVRYGFVGLINTFLHWTIFYLFLATVSRDQSLANLLGFFCANLFGFVTNSKFTFRMTMKYKRYFLYLLGMGSIAALIGLFADELNINPIFTLVFFSLVSFMIGYIYSNYFVFREKV
ncbi:GtrA family protein [Celerinatantimonas yamalensis]|uniref:Bactoprenol-linked glucose translocase n=1 Tax=Celerinatantimonas yamalensis TaxID=559956 RepID=A0ABW9GBK6_9GAMM